MKGIIFSTHMAQAIQQGRKTQTRRVVKQIRINHNGNVDFDFKNHSGRNIPKEDINSAIVGLIDNAPYKVGDVLYVKETYSHTEQLNIHPTDENYGYVYKADGQPWGDIEGWKWKSPMFMPEKAARLFIVITGLNFERLGDISWKDIIKEGIETELSGIDGIQNLEEKWQSLWQSIHSEDSWYQNPWVWAYTFEIYQP